MFGCGEVEAYCGGGDHACEVWSGGGGPPNPKRTQEPSRCSPGSQEQEAVVSVSDQS